MIKLIIRTFALSILFLFITMAVIYMFWGQNPHYWEILYRVQFAKLALGVWILIPIVAISFFIALWAGSLTTQKDRHFGHYLEQLYNGEIHHLKLRKTSRKNIKALLALDELIQTQKKSLQRLTNSKANIQEQEVKERIVLERQRLARELHDSVSQQLFAASMLLSATNETSLEQLPEASQKQLQQVEKIVQQAQLEMRALLLHLRPVALKNKTLAQGLQDLLDELRQKAAFNIKAKLEEVTLPKGAEDHIFRIAQETLSNTLRHSKASEVYLLLVERNDLVIFRLQDNGVGFSIDDDSNAGSYGLRNIEERAIEIGGTCKIVSIPNEGTIIEVQIPVDQEDI